MLIICGMFFKSFSITNPTATAAVVDYMAIFGGDLVPVVVNFSDVHTVEYSVWDLATGYKNASYNPKPEGWYSADEGKMQNSMDNDILNLENDNYWEEGNDNDMIGIYFLVFCYAMFTLAIPLTWLLTYFISFYVRIVGGIASGKKNDAEDMANKFEVLNFRISDIVYSFVALDCFLLSIGAAVLELPHLVSSIADMGFDYLNDTERFPPQIAQEYADVPWVNPSPYPSIELFLNSTYYVGCDFEDGFYMGVAGFVCLVAVYIIQSARIESLPVSPSESIGDDSFDELAMKSSGDRLKR